MNWFERLIAVVSPAWAYRRAQFREALRQDREDQVPRRRDEGGWIPLDDPNNPLNPNRLVAQPAEVETRRRWTW